MVSLGEVMEFNARIKYPKQKKIKVKVNKNKNKGKSGEDKGLAKQDGGKRENSTGS